MFGGKKKPEDLTHDELVKIADKLMDYDRMQRTITDAISTLLSDKQYQETVYNQIAAYVNEEDIKQRVHNIINSDQVKEIIDEHVKSYLTVILDNAGIIDEIVQERVDAAGIDQVIQWNNIAYGMLLSRLEEIEKESKPNAEIIKGLFGK